MHLRRFFSVLAVAATCACAGFLPSTVRAAGSRAVVLIDFTNNRRERDGTAFHAYQYVFEEWQKHVFDLPRRGVLIQAPSGRGGLGENNPRLRLDRHPALVFHYLIGNANSAAAIAFSLEDSDGTVAAWDLPLAGVPQGVELGRRIVLTEPSREEKPGKKPGLDPKRIVTWQVKGDWAAPKVEVLLIKLEKAP